MAQAAESGDEDRRLEEFTDDAKCLSSEMLGILVGLTQGKALRVVQGTLHARNGFEAWRRLCAPTRQTRRSGAC